MRIKVHAKPRSKGDKVELLSPQPLDFGNDKDNMAIYKVYTKEPPVNNRANSAIIKLLASYFNVSISSIHLVHGHTSHQKIFEIE